MMDTTGFGFTPYVVEIFYGENSGPPTGGKYESNYIYPQLPAGLYRVIDGQLYRIVDEPWFPPGEYQ